MANKNTKRKNKATNCKRGIAINSENRGRFSPRLTPEMAQRVGEIKNKTKRIYG